MLRKLASQSVIYGGSTILSRAINFVLVPLHTGVFAPDSYGVVAVMYAYAAFFNIVFTYGMETAYFRFASLGKEGEQQYYNSAVTSILISSCVFSGSLIFFSSEIAVFLSFENSEQYVEWFALLLAIDAVVAIPFAKLRQNGKAFYFAGVKLANVILNVGLNAFFLIFCRKVFEGEWLSFLQEWVSTFYSPNLGLGYAFLSNLIANALLLVLLLPVFRTWKPSLKLTTIKPMYQYAYPLIFTGLAGAINEVLDKILIEEWLPANFYQHLTPAAATGIYSACYKLAIFIVLAVQGFRYAAEPFFFSTSKEKAAPATFALVMDIFVLVCVCMSVGVVANVGWISAIFLQKDIYHTGLHILPYLFTAQIFLGIFYNLSVWYKVSDKTHLGALISIIGAFITLVGNYILLPIVGYVGSAITTMICYAFMAILSFLVGKKYYPIPYNTIKIGFYLTIGFFTTFLLLKFELESELTELVVKNMIFLAISVILLLTERKKLSEAFLRNNR